MTERRHSDNAALGGMFELVEGRAAPSRPRWRTSTTQSAVAKIGVIGRPIIGWFCIALGLLGMVLPILPGLVFLVPGIALVGRRTWIIRWTSVTFKRLLRRLAPLQTPVVGSIGRWALGAQHEFSRRRRRLVWRRMERRRARASTLGEQ